PYLKRPPPTAISTFPLHDALPIWDSARRRTRSVTLASDGSSAGASTGPRSDSRLFIPDSSASSAAHAGHPARCSSNACRSGGSRSEEHTSELQSLTNLVCRLLLVT